MLLLQQVVWTTTEVLVEHCHNQYISIATTEIRSVQYYPGHCQCYLLQASRIPPSGPLSGHHPAYQTAYFQQNVLHWSITQPVTSTHLFWYSVAKCWWRVQYSITKGVTVKPVLTDLWHGRPPVLKDHIFLAEQPPPPCTFQYNQTCHDARPPVLRQQFFYVQWGSLSRQILMYITSLGNTPTAAPYSKLPRLQQCVTDLSGVVTTAVDLYGGDGLPRRGQNSCVDQSTGSPGPLLEQQ